MAFSDFSLTGGILFTMWFFIAAIALTVILLAFYSFRQRTGKTVPDKDRLKTEISGDIGIPLEVIDPEKAGQIDRRTGAVSYTHLDVYKRQTSAHSANSSRSFLLRNSCLDTNM